MSPAVFVFLPLTLLLLMSKGAGAHSKTPTPSKATSGKVMGILTEEGDFIPLPSLTNGEDMNADNNGVVIEQNGHRYLLATVKQ
ncbi:MAG: hypothetical protein AAGA46_09910 [Cyanobacteria bacterium P01_F01_bin.13]